LLAAAGSVELEIGEHLAESAHVGDGLDLDDDARDTFIADDV
jgi:hypothetical protein